MHRVSVVTLCGALALALVGCSPDKSADTSTTTATSTPPATAPAPPPATPSAGAAPEQKPGGDETAKDTGKDTKKAGGSAPKAGGEKGGKLVTTASGLQYEDIKVGTGPSPTDGQAVTVDYTGTLADGTKFDSNVDPAFHHVAPFTFHIGQHEVIAGWDEGVLSMKVGGQRKLIIPANLAYGDRSPGPTIPPGSTLTFIVELKGVQ